MKFARLILILLIVLNFCLADTISSFADNPIVLPSPGTLLALSPSTHPIEFKGLVIDPAHPMRLSFLVDTGKKSTPENTTDIQRLINYFLTGLTIPENDLWVNLSPYEHDRIAGEALSQTELGRDLLSEDYILKQLTASLIYPHEKVGKDFWQHVYEQAKTTLGTTQIPVKIINKVWIVPKDVDIVEQENAVYISKSTLKVMLDEDYLALKKGTSALSNPSAAEAMRTIVIPQLEREVNQGAHFECLRQIFSALILSKWYKETVKNPLLNENYINKNKIKGIDLEEKGLKEHIYAMYLQAYRKGVFNYVNEETTDQGIQTRHYFSGGLQPMPKKLIRKKKIEMEAQGEIKRILTELEIAEQERPHADVLEPKTYQYSPDGKRTIEITSVSINPRLNHVDLIIDKHAEGHLHSVDRATNRVYYVEGNGKRIENPKLIRNKLTPREVLLSKFLLNNPSRMVVAQSSYENLFYNKPVWIIQKDRIFHAMEENVENRPYSAFLLLDDGTPGGKPLIRRNVFLRYTNRERNKVDILIGSNPVKVRYAFTIQMIYDWNGAVKLRPSEFDDPRHLFALPKIHVQQSSFKHVPMSDGIFAFSDDILKDNGTKIRQYFNYRSKYPNAPAPELTFSLRNKPYSIEALKEGLTQAGYKPEDYQINDQNKTIQIRLRENIYPFHIIGVTKNEQIKEIVTGGSSGKQGLTVREAAELAQKEDLVSAGIADQGTTSRLEVGNHIFGTSIVDKNNFLGPRSTAFLLYTQEKPMLNPLTALSNKKILKVFRQILERRYDVRVLAEVYGLGNVPDILTYKGKKYTVKQYVSMIITFLQTHMLEPPAVVASKFAKAFPERAEPPELKEIFSRYMTMKGSAFDLKLIEDLLVPGSEIADIGTGRGELAEAIDQYSKQKGLNINVHSTDIQNWLKPSLQVNRGFKFLKQDSGGTSPLPTDSMDLVIVKWAMHHMSSHEQEETLRSMYRILKPGGRLVFIEALGTEIRNPLLLKEFKREQTNPNFWPPGSYVEDYDQLNRDFFELEPEEQMKINALEDEFGHNLIMGRGWYQQFNYHSVYSWEALASNTGLVPDNNLRRIYGISPVQRMGPPTVRLVFEKPNQSISVGDAGSSKSFMLIDGLTPTDIPAMRNVLNVLVDRSTTKSDLIDHPCDDTLVYPTIRFDALYEALSLLEENATGRIIILEPVFQDNETKIAFVRSALRQGYGLYIGKGQTVTPHNLGSTTDVASSIAEMTRQVMFQMIQRNPKLFPNLNYVSNSDLYKVLYIPKSNLPFALNAYKNLLVSEGAFTRIKPYRIVYLGAPLEQLYHLGELQKEFQLEINAPQPKLLIQGHPVTYQNQKISKNRAIMDILSETWKLILDSEAGNEDISLAPKYKRGIVDLPKEFWKSAQYLLDQLGPKEGSGTRYQFTADLVKIALRQDLHHYPSNDPKIAFVPNIFKRILQVSRDSGLEQFLKDVVETSDKAMQTDKVGGIDLNGIAFNKKNVSTLSFKGEGVTPIRIDGLKARILGVYADAFPNL